MHNNIYVLDTTVLIDNPEVIYDLNGLIAVPITVIRQLDGLKKSTDTDVALKARRASRMLDEITVKGDPVTGITMPNGSIFKLTRKYTPVDTLDNIADNKIVGTADALKKEATNNANVILLTTDVNMRIAARERGIEAKEIINERKELIMNEYMEEIEKLKTRKNSQKKTLTSLKRKIKKAIYFLEKVIYFLKIAILIWFIAGCAIVIIEAFEVNVPKIISLPLMLGILVGMAFGIIVIIIDRLIEYALGKTKIEEEMEEENWITDPSYFFMPGNIFHDHTTHEYDIYKHNMKD